MLLIACSLWERMGSQALEVGTGLRRCLFLKRGCVFRRPQEEEGETAGEDPQGPHHTATKRTSPVSVLSLMSGSLESLQSYL